MTPEILKRLQGSPVEHIQKVQGVASLQPYQIEICQAIAANPFTAIAACHDVGKTFTISKAVLWFGSCFPRSKIITTAPTWVQVESLLWSEIRTGFSASRFPLGGRMLTTDWKIDDDWFALGLSPRDDADSTGGGQGKTSGFQGFHAPYVLVIFDEATGVPTKRWIQAQGMLTSANVRFVAIGNPTTKNSEFYKCFQSRLWKKIYISCFDSPNLIANGITTIKKLEAEVELVRELPDAKAIERIKSYKVVMPALLTLQWVVDRALVWKMDHPLFISKALGRFPEEDDSTLIPLGVVEKAQGRELKPVPGQQIGLGVDVARYGDDSSVLTTIWGKTVMKPIVKVKKDTMEISGAVVHEINSIIERGGSPNLIHVGIDATGLGAGVFDAVKEAQRANSFPGSVSVHEVHFGQGFDYHGKSDSAQREIEEFKRIYTNRKAKIFVELGEDLKGELSLPGETVYQEELPTILSRFDSKGRHVMETKEDYRDRTGRPSPDHADSLAIANEMRKMKRNRVGVIRVA